MSDKFIYEQKETYSQEEVKALLEQNSGFVSKGFKGFVSKEDHEKVVGELKPFKLDARKKHISSLVGELTTEDKLSDAISLAHISDEDDDEAIMSKIKETIAKRAYLQKDAGIAPELKKKTATKTKKESKKTYRFM